MENGKIHIYTGDGKGKTSAATGLAVRAAGQGFKVAFFQFLKNGTSGEISCLNRLGIHCGFPKGTDKFIWEMDTKELQQCRIEQDATLQAAIQLAGTLDLLVLDEAIGAMNSQMLDNDSLFGFLQNKPKNLELVLTGRNASHQLCALADYITEMKLLRHPFETGLPARKGIEF